MSDQPTDSGENTPEDSHEDESENLNAVDREEYEALAAKHNRLGKQNRDLQKRIEELEAQTKQASNSKKPTQDVDQLKESFRATLAEKEAEVERYKTQFERQALEGQVKQMAADLVIDVDDFWMYAKDHVHLVEEDGKYVPDTKDSVLSLPKFIEDYRQKKPHNAKSSKQSGDGVPKTKDAGGSFNAKQLANMNERERKKALQELDPKDLAKLLGPIG